ncbi:MAG: S41 family peptidase, partial [Planctomycetota bacterium]|nr:S41 family peptidase [Planctomycetota bacterium]
MIWLNAQDGNPDLAFELIERLPADDAPGAIGKVRSAYERRAEHLAEAEKDRLEAYAEARDEMTAKAEENDLSAALRSAIEMQTLSPAVDRESVTRDPLVVQLVREAEEKAATLESDGKWLEAQELYLRLHLLFEEQGRYRRDIERVSQRLTMLRLYVPRRLHDMRNEARLEIGEDELPPFNEIGEDWSEKLDGITARMVMRAMLTAQKDHVDGADLGAMLTGGLSWLRTMATTPDLVDAFPRLRDQDRVRDFTRAIDARIDELGRLPGRASYFQLKETLDDVMRINARTLDLPETALLHEFGNGAMSRLDDYSSIIWPDELRRFERSTQGSFTGVGIQISMDEANQIVVVTPLEGTPAQRAGIKRNDIIRAVDGESTLGITTSQAVDRITGRKGTPVTLSVERSGEKEWLDFRIVRDVIPIYSVKGWERSGAGEDDWDWFIDDENRIGYVRITQFTEQTTRELRRAIRQMQRDGVNGLIVDLRFNPGGLLSEAVGVANVFVEEGVIVSQHDANGITRDR